MRQAERIEIIHVFQGPTQMLSSVKTFVFVAVNTVKNLENQMDFGLKDFDRRLLCVTLVFRTN